MIDPADVARYAAAARRRLQPVLAATSQSEHVVTAIGHAHIDSAWLWPIRETKRKCARTFSNQLRLMDEYPEHRFACSQAQQYQWMKDDYPGTCTSASGSAWRTGRWEPVGGMWVEADSNIPSGESLVRQLVHGKRFFADEFGVETDELWIPDVFGYSAALPADRRPGRCHCARHPEDVVERHKRVPAPHVLVGGPRRHRLFTHFPPCNTYNGDW